MITGIYNLPATLASQSPLQEVWLECDTTLAPVTINLFEIAELNRQWLVKIHIVDSSANASNNNIVINTAGSDGIDGEYGTSYVINTNNGSALFLVANETTWFAINGSGVGNQYKMRQLPNSSDTYEWDTPEQVMGEVIDNALLFNPPYLRLTNGNIAAFGNCITQLKNGAYVFFAQDLETLDPNPFVWVVMEKSSLNPTKLEFKADLQFTPSFFNNFYTYTVKEVTSPDVVTFVTSTVPFNDASTLESYITTLTYSNGTLTATDYFYDFNGETALSLFNNLTGLSALTITPSYTEPIFSGDDDFAAMMLGGNKVGWTLYWDTSGSNYPVGSSVFTWVVGYNILTGEVKAFQPVLSLASVTNFNPVDIEQAIVNVYSHPKGALFVLDDQQAVTNGISLEGVTSIWSSEWINNKKVVYLNNRGLDYSYANTNGNYADVWGYNPLSIPVSSDYFFAFDSDPNNPVTFMMWRWKLDASDISYEFSVFPLANELSSIAGVFVLPTVSGFLIAALSAPLVPQYSPDANWIYWADYTKVPYQIQWNGLLPTNFLNNTLSDTDSAITTMVNWMTYGLIENKFSNIKF